MFKLKTIYEYLGAGDPELNARVNARCPSCSPPVNPATDAYLVGAAAEAVGTGWLEPKVVKLTSTTGLVIYRNPAGTTIKGRVVTIGTGLSLSFGAEQTIVSSSGIQSLNLVYVSDNKVMLAYMQSSNCTVRILNISGATVTPAALTVANTASLSTYGTNPIRSELTAPLTVLLCFSNSDNNRPSLQVLTISALDVITAGLAYKGMTTNHTRHNVALLTATKGVIVSFSTSAVLETFTIAGTVITFGGVQNLFPNNSQIPLPTTKVMGSGFMHTIDSASVMVCGPTSTSLPTITNGMYSFIAEISGSAATSTTIFKQDTENGTVNVAMAIGGKSAILYRKFVSGTDYIPRLLYNDVSGATPSAVYQEDVVTSKVVGFPEMAKISEYNALVFWEGGTTGVEITGIAFRVS